MKRTVRCQGAILRGAWILLIKHCEHSSGRSYWLLPGGGQEEGETEEQCVIRELKEETGLEVKVEQLILDEAASQGGHYDRIKTYWCTILFGEAAPGYEPEPDAAARYAIAEVGWFDLSDEAGWGEPVSSDRLIYTLMKKIQAKLGYSPDPTGRPSEC